MGLDVSAAASRINWLIEAMSASPEDLRAERARSTEMRSLQAGLAEEFGRLRGWRLDRVGFSLATLARNGVSGSQHWPEEHDHAFLDHLRFYRQGRRARAIVSQPYNGAVRRDAIMTWAARRGLRASFPSFPSWWFPGETTLVVYEPASLLTTQHKGDGYV
jgi:hypothetical protein